MKETLKILLVEDDEVDRMAFARFLEDENLPYEVTVATSLAEGKRTLQEKEYFDAILIDYSLGDGVGLDLFGEVKDTPIIMLTGTGDEKIAVEAMKMGAYDYLVKDPEAAYLTTLPITVENAIKRKLADDELKGYREYLEELIEERTEKLIRANEQLKAEIEVRQRAEQALQESELRYRALFESAPVGIGLATPNGQVLAANQAMCHMVGRSEEELKQVNLNDVYQYPEEREALLERLQADGFVRDFEVRLKHKDGAAYIASLTVTSIVLGDEDVLLTVAQDITKQVQLEEQYRQAQKMEAIGRLTGGIAHDFNNLLTAINGFAELLQLALSPDSPHQELVGKIRDAGQSARHLVNQLLAFSRKQIIQPQVLDLNDMMREMNNMLQRLIREDIQLKTVLTPDLWPVEADPSQLQQVLLNLTVNACDAMPGGGQLTIETANVVLDRKYTAEHLEVKPGDYVLLAISDTGIGMSPEVQSRIFEPFFTTKSKGEGTGLGLSTVYGIVRQSGGHIWVYSEKEVGTTFKIYLPRAEKAPQPLPRPQTRLDLPTGSETILLVEDDAEVRDLAQRVLQKQGYTLLEAQDGQTALQIAATRSGSIHLLLTDVIMPGMSGTVLAERLTQSRPHIKTLFISGYTNDAIAQHGVIGEGVDLLQKPFTPTDLARKVREVLDS